MDFLVSILHSTFKAQGRDDLAACETAAREIRKAFKRLDVDLAERDARIVELRGSMTEAALAERFGLTTRRIRQIIRAHYITTRAIA